MLSILSYCCETWSIRVTGERMLEVFYIDSIRRILHVRCKDFVPSVELRRRFCLTSVLARLVQRRLCWFGHAARCPDDELIKDLFLPTPPRRPTGGQMNAWATIIKTELEPSADCESLAAHGGKKGFLNVCSELAQGRRA